MARYHYLHGLVVAGGGGGGAAGGGAGGGGAGGGGGGKVTWLRLVLSFGTPLQRDDTATHFVGLIHASAVFLPVPSTGPTCARLVVAVLTSSGIPTPSQSRSVNTGVSSLGTGLCLSLIHI